MRITTTNLENRRSPWTDLIALIKVHLYSAVKIANSTILANPTLSQLFRADSTSGFCSCKKVDFVPPVTTTFSQQLKSTVLMISSILQNSLDHDSLSAALSRLSVCLQHSERDGTLSRYSLSALLCTPTVV